MEGDSTMTGDAWYSPCGIGKQEQPAYGNSKMKNAGGKKMKRYNDFKAGRKAESIYTATKKNHLNNKRRKAEITAKCSICAYEEHVRRNAASKACYVYINGISMPVLSA